MRVPSIQQIQKLFAQKGYPFFDRGNYNPNTIGIRSAINDESGEAVPNHFNDLVVVCYKVHGDWRLFAYPSTTMPGLHYFKQPMLPDFGTAILVPGFYEGAYQCGLHFGKPALVQCGPLKLYRDSNRDAVIDLDAATIQQTSQSGINIHYSMEGVQNVDNWSAGCQVLQHGPTSPVYREFMGHYQAARDAGFANKFSYALVLEKDLV